MKRSVAKKGQLEKPVHAAGKDASAPPEAAVAKFFKGWRLALWAALLLGAFAAQALTSMAQKSGTSDENAHIPAGWTYLTTGDYRLNAEHPPLAKMIAALPLLFIKINGAFDSAGWREGKQWDYGWEFLFSGKNDAYTLFFLGRLSMVLLSLCLGLLIFFWARKLYGNAAGLFALFLFAFCPNLIAHGSLANTDMAISFFLILALFCFDRAARRLTPLSAALAGLALGAALLAKFSAPLIIPMMAVFALVRLFDRSPMEVRFRKPSIADTWRKKAVALVVLFCVIFAVAYTTIWAGYRFRYSAYADGSARPLQFGSKREQPESAPYKFLHDNRLLPQAYLEGFRFISNTMTRSAFLDGQHNWDRRKPGYFAYWPHYFVMTTLYKTPVPTLIFFAVTVACAYWWSRKTWAGDILLLAAILIYFGVASLSNMNIGHRHILPVIPLAFIFVSKIVAHLRWRQRLDTNVVRGLFAALLLWYVYSAISIYPNYLAYFNEIAGGPSNGAKHLSDSNIDWGQDLILLKKYMDDNHIPVVHLCYFGNSDPRYYGVRCKFLTTPLWPAMAVEQIPIEEWTDCAGLKRGDYIAVSVTNLDETLGPFPAIRSLREKGEIAQVGHSIYIYKSPLSTPPQSPEDIDRIRHLLIVPYHPGEKPPGK